jgi:hypothetical protein
MKHAIVTMMFMTLCFITKAQNVPSAEKGVNYGKKFNQDSAIAITDLETKLSDGKYNGNLTGKVVEVCQEKGCWIKIDKGNGETILAKTNDEFFMPKNIVGKMVMLNGEASVKERSIKELKHYAADAGKSKDEIDKITAPKKELIFKLKGVVVMD